MSDTPIFRTPLGGCTCYNLCTLQEAQRVNYWAISIFWLGVSVHWSAFLTIVMQVRVAGLVAPEVKGTYLAWLAAAGAFLSTIIELIAGPISDRCTSPMGRRRPFILWGTLLSLPFILLFMLTANFWVLVFHFVMMQLFLNWANGPYQAVIPDYVPPERHGLASAWMGMMTLMGNLIGLALAGLTLNEPPLLFQGYSFQTRLLIVGVVLVGFLLTTMLWTVLGLREPRWQPTRPEQKRIDPSLFFNILLNEHPNFILLNEHPNFRWVVLSRFAFNLGFYTVLFYLEYYLRDTMRLGEGAPMQAFVIMTIATLTGMLGNWVAGVLADRTSKKRVMYYTAAIMGVGTLLFLIAPELRWVYLLGALFGFAWGALVDMLSSACPVV